MILEKGKKYTLRGHFDIKLNQDFDVIIDTDETFSIMDELLESGGLEIIEDCWLDIQVKK